MIREQTGRINKRNMTKQWPLHFMLLPASILALIFYYIPMAGIVIAFQKFIPAKGLFGDQIWVGLDNFRYLFILPDSWTILRNTVFIAVMKIILGIIVPISICLMLNEIRQVYLKRSIQSLI